MWTWPQLRTSLVAALCGLQIRFGHLTRVDVAGLLETSRTGVDADHFQRLGLTCVGHEALDAFCDVVNVAGSHVGPIRTRARDAAPADDIVKLLAPVEPVLLMEVPRQELRPIQRGGTPVVTPDRHAGVADAPALLFVQVARAPVLD